MGHFLRTKAAQFEMEVPDVPAPELERLYSHDWPGNVRELEFVIERSLLLSRSKAVGTPLAFETPANGVMLKKATDVGMGTNLATGTPSFYRLEPLGDTGAAAPELVRLQGSVGPAGDLRLDVAALVIDEVQPVNYFDLQMPASMLG